MKELTPMQAASWVGRQSDQRLGGVAAHLYAEFDSVGLDVGRLRQAVSRLYQAHPMLRLRITPAGQQTIEPISERYRLQIDDLRDETPQNAARRLEAKRRRNSTQKLALEQGQACDISLSLLADTRCRLHVDVDMIAADAWSFRILLEDLARLYRQPQDATHQTDDAGIAWFRYLDKMRADENLQRRYRRDRRWWQARLSDFAPAPRLPHDGDTQRCRSDRLAARLTSDERRSLEKTARAHHLTPSTLFLCAFAGVLAAGCDMTRFRLNLPMFHRAPYVEAVGQIIGDFSSLVILDVTSDANESLLAFCRRMAPQLARAINHSHYPGVNVLRDLSRRHGSLQIAPVVFTSGFGLPGGQLFSDAVRRSLGEMNWVISQGPQVALDAQAVEIHDGILLNWDVRLDVFPAPLIRDMFDRQLALLRRLARDPAALHQAPVWRQAADRPADGSTERLLLRLLNRLSGARTMGPDSALGPLTAQPDAARQLLNFINQYLPASRLTLSELQRQPSAAGLARLIVSRSPDKAEQTARRLLKALDAGRAAAPR
ncbi:glutamate racemase [Affinibrenneria salicis]|uniref:Glutamate racemase n=2 Tax=Affinibrenneria salicis TaxID=2590031 RepID=A0A5J5G3K4_9GAMM|nr:glutamate racemase [Affinibrenneria salicis]